jgi:DNA-binding transcriptional LysR family regulator
MDYSSADHVTAIVADLENEANQVSVDLTPEPGQRGSFRGEAPASLGEGHFRVRLKEEEEEQAHADFTVVIPQLEMETPDMKKELLDNVAKSSMKGAGSGEAKVGMYFADQAGQLLKDLNQAQREIEEKKENTLWDAPILLILFTLFMGTEWLVRKRNDLL